MKVGDRVVIKKNKTCATVTATFSNGFVCLLDIDQGTKYWFARDLEIVEENLFE